MIKCLNCNAMFKSDDDLEDTGDTYEVDGMVYHWKCCPKCKDDSGLDTLPVDIYIDEKLFCEQIDGDSPALAKFKEIVNKAGYLYASRVDNDTDTEIIMI